jgi:hypothetical protein
MSNVIKDYLEALDERASQVGGLNQGQQYIIGFLYGTLKKLQLQGHYLHILERDTRQLKGMIQWEKDWNERRMNDNN